MSFAVICTHPSLTAEIVQPDPFLALVRCDRCHHATLGRKDRLFHVDDDDLPSGQPYLRQLDWLNSWARQVLGAIR